MQSVKEDLTARFGDAISQWQAAADGIPTLWVTRERAAEVLLYLKTGIERPYGMLYDLFGLDERMRRFRNGQPQSDFTIVYHLLSFDRNDDIRVKVASCGEAPSVKSVTGAWPSANWYEREAYDMFGVKFDNHPGLSRILMPPWWQGHPLRKEHPSRATDMPPYVLPKEKADERLAELQFVPPQTASGHGEADREYLYLNVGPHHTGTHGLLRIVCKLDGERIEDATLDIGYHHRGAEKMAERQTWHTFIPYTDRIDYLAGAANNLAYVLAVEKLAGVSVPPRAQCIRVMLAELYRISSHLVFLGTLAQDIGAMSPVFYMFTDRERVLEIIEAVCGARMHPNWLRIGGVAEDLPRGWDAKVREFVRMFPRRLDEYDSLVLQNPVFKRRTMGIGEFDRSSAVEWGVTGPGLRACGFPWDMRKNRPYCGYENFDFEVPVAQRSDCYNRTVLRVEEMRQSVRIVEQCLAHMPGGNYKSDHPLAGPPRKEKTMHDIETLITHFLSVTWGPVIPCGEAHAAIEAPKGVNGYYVVSDGGTASYRTRIRTPSFAHLQMTPTLCRGAMLADLFAILGAVDFVLADVDR